MAKAITRKSSKSVAKAPTKVETKSVIKNHSNLVSKNTKTAKDSHKDIKNDNCMAYFWGGLGIVLCAAGALVVLLWGIGAMLNK